MIIGIADDEKAVTEAYDEAIRKLGHRSVVRTSVRKMMEYIKDEGTGIDILFLDHHFRGEETGVAMIAEILKLRPGLDIIITTKQPLEPNFIQEIIDAGVGFFKKSVIDPVWLEMEISQRVNIRKAKLAQIRSRLEEFSAAITTTREGICRIPLFRKGRAKKSLRVTAVEKLPNQYVYPTFDRILTVHAGQTKVLSEEASWESTVEIKAGTTRELGLKYSESAKFFGSALGLEILGKLKKEQSITEKKTLKTSFKAGQTIQILESEHKKGVRKREFYRGILHTVFRVEVKMECLTCSADTAVDIFVLVPDEAVEVSVAYDKKGYVLMDEDGRSGHLIWRGGDQESFVS